MRFVYFDIDAVALGTPCLLLSRDLQAPGLNHEFLHAELVTQY